MRSRSFHHVLLQDCLDYGHRYDIARQAVGSSTGSSGGSRRSAVEGLRWRILLHASTLSRFFSSCDVSLPPNSPIFGRYRLDNGVNELISESENPITLVAVVM